MMLHTVDALRGPPSAPAPCSARPTLPLALWRRGAPGGPAAGPNKSVPAK